MAASQERSTLRKEKVNPQVCEEDIKSGEGWLPRMERMSKLEPLRRGNWVQRVWESEGLSLSSGSVI